VGCEGTSFDHLFINVDKTYVAYFKFDNQQKHKDFWNIQANCDQAMELWEENFQMLVRYKDQIGDCLVPKVFPANQVRSIILDLNIDRTEFLTLICSYSNLLVGSAVSVSITVSSVKASTPH
jgi:hypothetical protein